MKFKIILIFIFILAFVLRLFQLGNNPQSLDWDEASLGYNAYSILRTGNDEYGRFLPLSIRSFGDYKPPLYTYLSILPVGLFGLNEYTTRFTSAFFGSLTVVISYFLIRKLFPVKSFVFYLVFLLFFAISPWHIQFSRIAFEANVALFFFITGIWLFLKALNNKYYYPLSFTVFALSMYSYHSERLVIPVFLVGLAIIYRKILRENIRWFLIGLSIMIIMLLPLFFELKQSSSRFGSVTVINDQERLGESILSITKDLKQGNSLGALVHNRRIVYAREILAGYLDHFNFDFLFFTGDSAGRHHAFGMGMLYLFEFPLILIGIYYLLNNLNKGTYLIFWWFMIAPIASSLTKATPHAVRALIYIPVYQIFAAFGVRAIYNYARIPSRYLVKKFIFTTFILLFTANIFYYLHMYYIHTPKIYASWWQSGYKEAISYVNKLEPDFSKVIFTYFYDQPYIYYLFYNLIDPSWYQYNWDSSDIMRDFRRIGKYEFRKIDWSKDSQLKNVLLIGTPAEIPADINGLIREIKFPDGTVAFRIVSR